MGITITTNPPSIKCHDKDYPEKPYTNSLFDDMYCCPYCMRLIKDRYVAKQCVYCGQRLDWTGVD